MAQDIQIKAQDGGSFSAYLDQPQTPGKYPAVVVAQEIFGVNASMRKTVEWLASEGFIVAAPDIFWRQKPGLQLDPSQEADRNLGISLMQGLDETKAMHDIAATAQYLSSLDNCNGAVGVVGYCMGGKLAYLANIFGGYPAVSYYGVAIDQALDRADQVKAALLLHLPEQDELCPPPAQERLISALGSRPHVRILKHPNVGHAFARRNSPAYVAQAAEQADAATVTFLKENLV